tara:strand:- start:342 stop:1172 length:831 start_codon:yes stop_codon:yes gene_type:complete
MRLFRTLLGTFFLVLFALILSGAIYSYISPEIPIAFVIPVQCKGSGLVFTSCLGQLFGKSLVYLIPLTLGIVILPKSKTKVKETVKTALNINDKIVEPSSSSSQQTKNTKLSTENLIKEIGNGGKEEFDFQKEPTQLNEEIKNYYSQCFNEQVTKLDEIFTEFPKAKVSLEYRPELQTASEKIRMSSESARREILAVLENDPRIEQTILEELISEKYIGPFEKLELNEIFSKLQKKNDEAATKFKTVIEILGEDTDVKVIVEKIETDYSINVLDQT